ncbi:MAG: hypothetical protein GTO60_07440 [Gammaproteobacteria bacterium]|nr:hypothetical protein [Gammaproteobacteria bacterium]
MHKIQAIQKVVAAVRAEFADRLSDTAINVFLTIALEPGINMVDLESKLDLTRDEILSNVSILMTLRKPGCVQPGLVSLEQGSCLRLSPGGERLSQDLRSQITSTISRIYA